MASVNVGSVTASIVLDSREFKTGVTSVKNMVKELKTALNSIGKNDTLSKTLRSLNKEGKNLGKSLQGVTNNESIKNSSNAINDTSNRLKNAQKEASNFNKELSKTGDLHKRVNEYASKYKPASIDTTGMQKAVSKMQKDAKVAGQQAVAKSLQSGTYSAGNLSMLRTAQEELGRLDAKAQSSSKSLNNLNKSASNLGKGLNNAGCNARQLNTNMGLLHGTSSKLSRTLGMFTSIYTWGFIMNLGEAISNTVQAKSEMDAYVQSLNWGRGEVNYFNNALEKTVKHFQKMNKFNLGETALSLGVEFELGAKELEDAMPVLAMIQSEYIRAGRSEEEATLAVKDIMQGEFLRLSRETGVGKGELTAAGWSGDTKDIESLLEALKKVGESRHWDVFATKATSLSDVLTIAQNRLTEFATEIISMVTPAITGGFNAIIDTVDGVTGWFDSLPQWAKNFISLGSAIGVAGVSLAAFIKKRTGLRLLEISHYGLKNSIVSAITGIKAECVAANGLKASLLSMVTGLDGNIIKQNGFLSAMLMSKKGLEAAQLSSLGLMQKLTLLSTNLKVAQVEGMTFAQSLKAIATSATFLKGVGLGVALTAISVGFAMVQDACAKAKKAVDGFYDVVDMGDQYIEDWTKKVDNYKNSISTLESDYESLKAQGKDTTEVENNLARARNNLTVATENLTNVQKAYEKAKEYKVEYDKKMSDAQLDQQRRMIGIYEKLGLTHNEATEKSNDYMANVTAGIKYMEEGAAKYTSVLESGSKHISEHTQYLKDAGVSQKQLTTYAEDYGVELNNNADLWNKFIQGDIWAGVGVILSDLKLMWIDLSNDPTIIAFWNNLNAAWQQILPTLQTLWNILKNLVMNGLGALNSLMSTSTGRWVAIGGAIASVGVGISLLKDGVKGTISHFKTLKEGISTFVTSIKNGNVKETLSDFGSSLKDRLTGYFSRDKKGNKNKSGKGSSDAEEVLKKEKENMKKTGKTAEELSKVTTTTSETVKTTTGKTKSFGTAFEGFGASLGTILAPIAKATIVIGVVMGVIALLAAEALLLISGIKNLIQWLNFDEVDLKPSIEGIKDVGTALWEVANAMGAMATVSVLTLQNNLLQLIGQLTGTPDLVAKALQDIRDVITTINDMENSEEGGLPSLANATVEKLENINAGLTAISGAIKAIVNIEWDDLKDDIHKFLTNDAKPSDCINDMKEEILNCKDALESFQTSADEKGFKPLSDSVINNLTQLYDALTKFKDIWQRIQYITDIAKKAGVNGKNGRFTNPQSADSNMTFEQQLTTIFNAVQTTATKLKELDKKLSEANFSEDLKDKLEELKTIVGDVSTVSDHLQKITDKKIDTTILENNLTALSTASEKISNLSIILPTNKDGEIDTGGFKEKMDALKSVVGDVKTVIEDLQELSTITYDSEQCITLITSIRTIYQHIVDLNGILREKALGADYESNISNFQNALGYIEGAIFSLQSIDAYTYQSQQIVTLISSMRPVSDAMVSLNARFREALVGDDFGTNANKFANAVIAIKPAINALTGEVGVFNYQAWFTNIVNFRNILTELQKIPSELNLSGQSTVSSQVITIINNISTTINTAVPNVQTASKGLGGAISNGIKEGIGNIGVTVVNKITGSLNANSNVLYTKGRWIGGRINSGYIAKLDLETPTSNEISSILTILENNKTPLYDKGKELGEQLKDGFNAGMQRKSPGALYKATVSEMGSIMGSVIGTIPQAYTQAFNLGNALYQGYRSSNIFTNPVNFSFGMDAATIQDDSSVLYSTVQDNANNIMALNNTTVQSTSQTFGALDTNMATTFTNIAGNVTNSYNKIKNTTQTDLNTMRAVTLNNINSIRNNWMQMQSALIASAETIRSGVASKIHSLESNLASFWNKLQNPTLLMASAGDAPTGKGTTSHHIRGGSMSSGFRKSATGLMKRGNTRSSPKGVKYAGGGKNTGSKSRNNNSNSLSLDSFFKNISKSDIAFLDDYLKCMLSGGGCYAGGWSFNWTDRIMEMIHQWGVSFDLFGDGGAISLKVGDFVNSTFPINGANGGASAFVPYIISMISKTRYGKYYNSRYGNNPIAAYNAGVFNCWDGANIIAAVAAAFGLKSELRRGTWNGIPHVWRYVYGVGNVDATAIQGGYGLTAPSRCNYGGGVSAPRVKDNCGCNGDTNINVTVNVDGKNDEDLAVKIGDTVRDVIMDIVLPDPATAR